MFQFSYVHNFVKTLYSSQNKLPSANIVNFIVSIEWLWICHIIYLFI